MYRTMIRKQRRSGAILLCLLLASGPAFGMEKAIELGKDGLWRDLLTLDGVEPVPGRWGFQDLALRSGEYDADSSTELLLHFDAPASVDSTRSYRMAGTGPVVSDSASALGGASAAFTGARQGFALQAQGAGMFSPGAVWEDFTIEFWLSPATLSDGESIISWAGSAREGTGTGSPLVAQAMRCFISDRRLVWDFQEVFALPPGGAGSLKVPVSLSGTRRLLPRAWHHHLLRFDSREGLLEYLLDGVPEAILHVTDTGSETGSIAVPMIGAAYAGPLSLGQGYTGFMDELRISRRFVDDAVTTRFLARMGSLTSRIIDLGFSGTRIARIEAVTSTPSDTAMEFFYQVSDTWGGRKLLRTETDWIPFVPGTNFSDTLKARYLQLRVELSPDGSRTQTPRLSSLRIVYEPNLPPAPPAGLTAAPGNGKVTLSWRKVNDLNVKGYLVYYGSAPHSYLGTGAAQGDSPIDAGAATTLVIEGLSNASLYYFSVAAYDGSDPRQQSPFSPEVSARPSRIYK
jgi:hypothetical protein